MYLRMFNHLQDAWKLLTTDGDKQWTMMEMRQLRNSYSLPRSLPRMSHIDLSQSCRSSARRLCLHSNISTLSSLAHQWYAGDFGCDFIVFYLFGNRKNLLCYFLIVKAPEDLSEFDQLDRCVHCARLRTPAVPLVRSGTHNNTVIHY